MSKNQKVAIIIDQLFQDSEVTDPKDKLENKNFIVDVIGPNKSEEFIGKKGTKIKANKSIDEVSAADYVGLVIPGGWAPDKMRMNQKMVKFVEDINAKSKPIACICHGGSMLVEADIVKGKRLTSYASIRTDLINAGAKWVDKEVVVDGNLITSRTPADLPAFCAELLKALSLVEV
ncbi:MAG: protease [Candidatus Melainabacteria bacterium RIFCSPHIGHO2_02_FULL_34_12]|nr:MAG: protease [Candidatus Melainabacteria bacterium RIFCSPHIGHO2_02_FULL_34_12]